LRHRCLGLYDIEVVAYGRSLSNINSLLNDVSGGIYAKLTASIRYSKAAWRSGSHFIVENIMFLKVKNNV